MKAACWFIFLTSCACISLDAMDKHEMAERALCLWRNKAVLIAHYELPYFPLKVPYEVEQRMLGKEKRIDKGMSYFDCNAQCCGVYRGWVYDYLDSHGDTLRDFYNNSVDVVCNMQSGSVYEIEIPSYEHVKRPLQQLWCWFMDNETRRYEDAIVNCCRTYVPEMYMPQKEGVILGDSIFFVSNDFLQVVYVKISNEKDFVLLFAPYRLLQVPQKETDMFFVFQ